jgi:hypothetical protein
MMEVITSNLYMITPALWASFTMYIVWYVTRAKHYSPITPTEARQLWTIHRQTVNCNGKKWRQIRRGGATIGFECDCGHRHIQKRPIVASMPNASIDTEVSAFDRLHTSHKST